MPHHPKNTHTLLGLLALLMWSASAAFLRELSESLGPLTSGALVLTVGGGIGLLYLAVVRRRFTRLFRQPFRYLLASCALIALYEVSWYVAIGMAANRAQMLVVNLINYLWPAFTLLLSIPVLKKRARWSLVPGILLALSGIALAVLQQGGLSFAGLVAGVSSARWIYPVMLAGALAWAWYLNLSCRWMPEAEVSSMPLYLCVAGLVMAVLRGFSHEATHWQPSLIPVLLFNALGPALVAYVLWDIGMRRGRMVLLTSCSYLTPLLSSAFACVVLKIVPGASFWIACGLVILGAVICSRAVDTPGSQAK